MLRYWSIGNGMEMGRDKIIIFSLFESVSVIDNIDLYGY